MPDSLSHCQVNPLTEEEALQRFLNSPVETTQNLLTNSPPPPQDLLKEVMDTEPERAAASLIMQGRGNKKQRWATREELIGILGTIGGIAFVLGIFFYCANGRLWGSVYIGEDEVDQYIGRIVDVECEIIEVKYKEGGNRYLNCGRKFPFQIFTAVIQPEDAEKVLPHPVLSAVINHDPEDEIPVQAVVSGRLKLHNGRAQIIITSKDQLRFAE